MNYDNKMLLSRTIISFSRWTCKHRKCILPSVVTLHSCILRKQLRTYNPTMAIRLFEGQEHAKLYAKYRPTYPDALYEEIFRYCTTHVTGNASSDTAIDVGCGSGQSTRPLCRYFRHVIGSDVSEEQIKSAIAQTNSSEAENIQFQISPGEDLSFLEDNSADLVTIAQALHWINHDLFYAEVERVLKPGGVFAAYGYGENAIDIPEAEQLQHEFYAGLLKGYWNEKRRHIETHFANLPFPFEPVTRIESKNISIHRQMPLSAYIGYLSTWSAWVKYKKVHPDSDELHTLHKKLHKVYCETSDQQDPLVNVYWPGFLILCRKPA